MLLEGKVALVTGVSSSIGRVTALAMAQAGAKVMVGDDSLQAGEAVVQSICSTGGQAIFLATDVTLAHQTQALVERTVQEFGRLDIAFNNVSAEGDRLPLAEQSEGDVANVIDMNLNGMWMCLKYQIGQMLLQGGGAIVNNGSVFTLDGFPGCSAYAATKAAVVGMTKAAALEYARQGIRINAVSPGPIVTAFPKNGAGAKLRTYASLTPMGRLGNPQEVAQAVVWLCSNQASFITGHTLPVDGGLFAQ